MRLKYLHFLLTISDCFLCGISDSENDVSEPMAKTSFPIDFTKLFHALNQATHTEEGTLLLYTLLHRNEAFKSFVLASSDVDLLGWDFVKKISQFYQIFSHERN